jgi:hypothetical protein
MLNQSIVGTCPLRVSILKHQERINEELGVRVQDGIKPVILFPNNEVELIRKVHQ